jgi:hypothetical protein
MMDTNRILQLAPVWNVDNPITHFLAWADRVETEKHAHTRAAGQALRGFAYVLSNVTPVRPSVKRFLARATPVQLMPWIAWIAQDGLDAREAVDFLNREFRI